MTFTFTPDFSAEKQVQPRVRTARFGDGYEQRIAAGLNSVPQAWALTFANRSNTERDAIEAYLVARAGVTAFDWTTPDGLAAKWVCREWNSRRERFNINTITATFEQVFEGTATGFTPEFSPAGLFYNGEAGGWWDPSDLTTLFQDSAGTTPVTALGQPVGLMRDRSGNGNHFTASGTARPTVEARVNLAVGTETFDTAGAVGLVGATVAQNAAAGPITGNAVALTENTSTGEHHWELGNTVFAANVPTCTSIYLRANGRTRARIDVYDWTTFSSYTAQFDLSAGGVVGGSLVASGTGASVSGAGVVALGGGWFRCWVAGTAGPTALGQVRPRVSLMNGAVTSYAGNGTSGIFMWGLQVEQGSTPTTYQRVTTATNYADIGLPRYLSFDGGDDFMTAASLNSLFNGVSTWHFAACLERSDGGGAFPQVYNRVQSLSPVTRAQLYGTSTGIISQLRQLDTTTEAGLSSPFFNRNRIVVSSGYNGAQTFIQLGTAAPVIGPSDTRNLGSGEAGALSIGATYSGRFYGLLFRAGVLAAATRNQLAVWMGARGGLTL